MAIHGIAAGPDNIADGEDPSLLATVDDQGNLHVTPQTVDQNGSVRSIAIDAAGRIITSDSDKLTAILIELRVLNQNLAALVAGQVATDDLDVLRLDAAASGLANTLS